MSLLDKLKGIINIPIDISNLRSVHFLSDNTIKNEYKIDNRTLNININSVPEKDIPKIQKAIREAVEEESKVLLEEKAKLRVEEINKEESSKSSQELISFFQGKLNPSDTELLRASLYIKSVYDKEQPIEDLKNDVINKYGNRGRHFVNLCTAGYFTSTLKPLYLEMEKEKDFSNHDYLKVFNKLINKSPFAIFVNSQMTPEDLLKNVQEQMKINKKYGINYLNIHGIGEGNITKIEKLLNKISSDLKELPDVESSRNYIILTIYF